MQDYNTFRKNVSNLQILMNVQKCYMMTIVMTIIYSFKGVFKSMSTWQHFTPSATLKLEKYFELSNMLVSYDTSFLLKYSIVLAFLPVKSGFPPVGLN